MDSAIQVPMNSEGKKYKYQYTEKLHIPQGGVIPQFWGQMRNPLSHKLFT